MQKLEKVREYADAGYNCVQSVLAAYGEDYGLARQHALKLSQDLGAGVNFRGEFCGAILAALMIYGLRFGSDKPNDELSNEILYKLSSEHIREFEAIHGSVQCNELLGYDVNVPEDFEKITEQGLFKWKCSNFIKDSVKILERKIEETKRKIKNNKAY
jgi:C_GCAxxG_C_C family probable redox protein